MLHDVKEVGLEELRTGLVDGKLLQQDQQNVEPDLGHVAHGVLEGPHDRVH